MNDDLVRQLEERNRQLNAVFRIASALYSAAKSGMTSARLDELMQEVLKIALDVVNADAGTLYLYNPERNTLVFRYVIGEKANELMGMEIPADKGIAGEVFQTGQAKITEDVATELSHLQEVDQRTGYRTRNMVTVPLRDIEGKPIGALQALNKRDGDFDEFDMETLSIVATLAGTAIETTRIQEERRLAIIARLLGNISHDIKNMLTPILTTAQTLVLIYQSCKSELEQLRFQVGEEAWQKLDDALHEFDTFFREAVQMIEEGSAQIQERVKEISEAVKGEISEPRFEPTDINEVAEKVLRALKPVAQRQGVELRLERQSEIPLVLLDPKRIYNALYNLVNNAIPETPPGGFVAVRTYVQFGGEFPDGNYLGIEVADNGRGIPEEVLRWMFTDRAISTKPGGTGLGTRIVKNVVDAHGGKIWVESELGKGSTFFIRLPLKTVQV
ncbi:MAG: GAF domain-containing sensor histidine kinase [Armatimonadetes bacterium]|nr:GAF domain-containing sensor histidine kinase [Armatimonadota bacterium]MCX7966898.1 GAF domain-containing sensor histidine kinase [Armatimonadota bacterium]MDW8141856.1 GAF domain-containing sensor histidine kinase [Armatimonadota bacterium]